MSDLKEKRDEFRSYLETNGAIDKLTYALLKLFQEPERPEDSVKFIRKQLCLECPDEARIEELTKKMDEMDVEKKKLDRELMMAKSSLRPSNSEGNIFVTAGMTALWEDETCKSLLKTHLTTELLEKIKDLKTEDKGTLFDNIKSGLENHDLPVGVYASDPQAYAIFNELYNPILEELHDTTPETKHPEEIDWGNTELFEDLDAKGMFIERIRLTFCRAIQGYPFHPRETAEQLQEIMEKIQSVLEKITDGELKGTFYALDGIDSKDEEKLKNDGVIFTNDDKFLISANAYRFWPVGRGVYVNEAKTFQVRINEEEHLQVISTDEGANLKTPYDRLAKALSSLTDPDLLFVKDPKLGYLAFNPASLGNTIEASVLIKIPKLMLPENIEKLEAVAKGNHLKITDKGDGITELCNTRKIGVTEFESVMEFQNGIKEVITLEKCQNI